jgi:hypothetical protein
VRTVRRILAVAAVLVVAAPAAAHACTQPPTKQPFAPFGDTSDYWLAPGGGFESGTAPWTLTNAAVTGENEKFFAGSQTDGQSLAIQPGGVAVSPAFCVDRTNPTMRLFAKKAGLGALTVELLYTNADGRYSERWAGVVAPTAGTWLPSGVLDLANAIPAGQVAKGDMSVRLRFTASQGAGAWAIDDVFIDPFRFD